MNSKTSRILSFTWLASVLLLPLSLTAQPNNIGPSVATSQVNFNFTAAPTITLYAATNGSSSNSGLSESQPLDLGTALAKLTNFQTVVLLDGTWSGVSWSIFNPTTVSGPATLKAKNKWQARLVNGPNWNLGLQGTCTNLLIDGLVISNSLADDGLGCVGTRFCTIQNCWVVSNFLNGINLSNGANSNNTVQNCLIQGNNTRNLDNQYHGIYCSGPNNVLRYNVSRYDHQGYGIQVYTGVAGDLLNNNQVYGNLTYGNGGSGTAAGIVCYGANGNDGTNPGTNYIYNNTILDALQLAYGAANVSNNLILVFPAFASDPIHNSVSHPATLNADYNCSTNVFTAPGPHDVITNYTGLGFANDANGLYWLMPWSAARGKASGPYPPFDLFGNSQKQPLDIGAFAFQSALAGDTRVLDPTPSGGADYWQPPSAVNFISQTIASASAWQTYTNVWGGATNTVDLAGPGDLVFMSPTACSFTGVLNKGSKSAQTVTVKLSNTSATNWNLTMASTFLTRDGARSYTVGPGQDLITTVCYDPGNGHTNTTNILNF